MATRPRTAPLVQHGFAAVRRDPRTGAERIDITSFNEDEADAMAVAEARDRSEFARLRASERKHHKSYLRIAPVTLREGWD